jgi:hypothetical protein
MDPTVKAVRRVLYQQLSMGGVSDWATDLQEYHDPPSLAASWADLINTVNLGLNPDQVGTRTGNWTQVQCDNQAVTWRMNMTAARRWSMADGNNAWNDVLRVWRRTRDSSSGTSFSNSVSNTLHSLDPVDCRKEENEGCSTPILCEKHFDTGAAAHFIWNSIVAVHQVCCKLP